MSFIFGGNTNMSYEDIQRKRAIADQLLASMGTPQNVGEGLSAIGKALAIRGINKKTAAADTANRDAFNSKWAGLFGGGAGAAPASVPQYTPPPPVDPASPQGIAADTMKALGKAPTLPAQDEVTSYIAQKAQELGIDPSVAVAVARSEGLGANPADGWQSNVTKNGVREPSYGPFQLYTGGGLGNQFIEQTGLDPRDPQTWQKQVDFALAHAANNGWGAWYGARNTGIGDFQGIPGRGGAQPANAGASVQPANMDVAQLAELAGDPYASPGQKAVVNALIERQLQAQDPAYQLGLEKSRLELDKLRNPASNEAELVQQRRQLAEISGLQPGTPEWQQFMLTGNTVGRGANEFGLTPVYGTDENGNVVIMQIGKDGTAIQTELPDGVQPNLGIRREEEARAAAVGKASGEAAASLEGARVTADRTLGLVDDLYNDPYLDRMVGAFDSRMPNVTSDAARVQSKMDQLQGTAFLEAYNMLRGGGQITEVEGAKAENAMARLKAAQNEEDYRQALMDFRDAVQTGIKKLEAAAGTTEFRTEPSDGIPTYNPQTGQWE